MITKLHHHEQNSASTDKSIRARWAGRSIREKLAHLHAEHISYDEIREQYTGYRHAYDWSHDPDTAGALVLFGPGQFSNLYPYLSRPAADAKFHIVGEAASAHHAWIVKSLDSAYWAVY